MKLTPDQITRFPWGRVVDVHSVGDYDIIEFRPWIFVNGRKTRDTEDSPQFHPYVDGKDASHSYDTLDRAIIGAIAYRHEGGNSRAAEYFFRMITP